ncbi:MAG: hypothetical protein GY746_08930 [Gammaproteobacteria bacterium]|nr:hypothetical protein [Gammaproteobacteria bacterium]
MVITDNWGYVKQAVAGLLGLSMLPSVALAESKFLSLKSQASPEVVSEVDLQ